MLIFALCGACRPTSTGYGLSAKAYRSPQFPVPLSPSFLVGTATGAATGAVGLEIKPINLPHRSRARFVAKQSLPTSSHSPHFLFGPRYFCFYVRLDDFSSDFIGSGAGRVSSAFSHVRFELSNESSIEKDWLVCCANLQSPNK